jgi:hypothetical protein
MRIFGVFRELKVTVFLVLAKLAATNIITMLPYLITTLSVTAILFGQQLMLLVPFVPPQEFLE